MNENMELIKHIYENSEMASYTTEVLLNSLLEKENKIKKICSELLNEYQAYLLKSKKILKKEKQELPKNSLISKMGAKKGIDKEVNNDNSDSSIADMLIKGISTGIIDTKKKIKNYKEISDRKTLKLAKDFLAFQEKYVEELNNFL